MENAIMFLCARTRDTNAARRRTPPRETGSRTSVEIKRSRLNATRLHTSMRRDEQSRRRDARKEAIVTSMNLRCPFEFFEDGDQKNRSGRFETEGSESVFFRCRITKQSKHASRSYLISPVGPTHESSFVEATRQRASYCVGKKKKKKRKRVSLAAIVMNVVTVLLQTRASPPLSSSRVS
jgi:hypothetical protein